MPLLDASRSILLVIDLQGRLVDQVHRPGLVLEASRRLLRLAEMFQVPVLLTEQYPKGIGATHPDIRAAYDALTTPKFHLEKTAFGCCGDPDFAALADAAWPGPRQWVVAGIEAHVCVLQTVLALCEAGEEVHVCWDAVSGRGEEHRRHALDRMAAAGATLTNHESVGFEWARHKDHPKFKELSALLKAGQPG